MNTKGATLEWRAHPARERIGAAVVASLAILAISGTVFLSSRSVPWSVVSTLLLLFSLNRFYFPSRFTIDSQRITATYLFRRQSCAWGKIIRFRHDANGAYLSTRGRPSRLDPFRGIHILFGSEKEKVIPRITSFMREAGTR